MGTSRWLLCVVLLASSAAAQPRCARYDPLRTPHFGDLHVHTALSLDASTQGTRAMPADAYRFARGEPLGVQPFDADGRPSRTLRLDRPLDFAAVTDHAELFGELDICRSPDLPGHDAMPCIIQRWFPRLSFFIANSQVTNSAAPHRFAFCGPDGAICRDAARTPWRAVQEAADAFQDHTDACRFTTFVGYEWTGAPGSNNLHRNVIYQNATVPDLPLSYVDEPQLDRFLARLKAECRDALPGCDVLTIPHNSNLSNGMMFATTEADGAPLSPQTATLRHDWEPLVEVMQHKGDSECRLGAETTDEACGFEKLPWQNFMAIYVPSSAEPAPESSFVRWALKQGLAERQRLGVNPFQYGLIASTDTHIAAAGLVRPDTFIGQGGAGAPPDAPNPGLQDEIQFNPGGLAVLWAEENSRAALFAAMRRREVYGTSGPRFTLRFFGGWDYADDLCRQPDFVARGYADGVPMGGELPAKAGAAPAFAVWALNDAAGAPPAPLQRVQIVKGWIEDGALRERVFDVAGGDTGASVDPVTCEPRGSGAEQLCSVWRDPTFVAAQPAFYYARVLQNPTCRWSAYACNARGVNCADPAAVPADLAPCCDTTYPKVVQQRAWSSPIWYVPEGGS